MALEREIAKLREQLEKAKPSGAMMRAAIDTIERHVALQEAALRHERERRKQIQPAAVAYQTLRERILRDGSLTKDHRTRLLAALPRTING